MSDFDPSSEVIGQYIQVFIQSAGKVSPVFEKKVNAKFEEEVGTIEPDEWYNSGDVKRAYQAILAEVGPKTMEEGGLETAKALPFPEETGVEEAFELLCAEHVSDDVYRNTDSPRPAGQYTHDVSDRSAHLGATEGYPYTRPFAKGLFDGVVRQYGPADASATFTETDPRPDEGFAWTVEW